MKSRVLLLTIIVFALVTVWRLTSWRLATTVSAKDVLAHATTGDVVLFRSNRRPWWYLAVVPMTHVGVVIKPPGSATPYILEMHQLGDGPDGFPNVDGPRVYPLEARLRDAARPNRRWELFYAPLQKPLPHAPGLEWAFPTPPYIPYDYDYVRHEAVCHFVPFRRRVDTVPEKMHCANYAASVLRRFGIADPTTPIDCITPVDVIGRGVPPGTYGPVAAIV
jgi:hypothetical protein